MSPRFTPEPKTISFALTPRQFSLIDDEERRVIEPGEFQIAVGGRQPGPKDLDGERSDVLIEIVEVTGEVAEV